MPSDLEDFKQTFYTALEDVSRLFKEHKSEQSLLFTELRKTVMSAMSQLSDESLRFQADIRDRLSADADLRAPRQKRADRKDIAVISSIGCVVIVSMLAACANAGVLAWLIWRGI